MISTHFSKDVNEFLGLLHRFEIRYLIVGGEAVIYYGHARLTGDIDIFYENKPINAGRLFRALMKFGMEIYLACLMLKNCLKQTLLYSLARLPTG